MAGIAGGVSDDDDTHKSKCPGGNQGTRCDDTGQFYRKT